MSGTFKSVILSAAAVSLLNLAAGSSAMAQGNPGNQQPHCGMRVESTPSQAVIEFDPLSDLAASDVFQVVFVNSGTGPCTAIFGTDLKGEPWGLTSTGGQPGMLYELESVDAAGNLTPRPGNGHGNGNANVSGIGPFTLQPGERFTLRFRLTIPTEMTEVWPADLYSQTIYLRAAHPNGSVWAETPIVVGVRVKSAALIGLKGEFRRVAGVPTINLGQLVEGDKNLNTDLYVISSSSYAVTVTSKNGGRLEESENSDWYVPYTLTVGQHHLNLVEARSWSVNSTRARMDEYPLSISIGSLADRRAGDYRDVVTFTVAAL